MFDQDPVRDGSDWSIYSGFQAAYFTCCKFPSSSLVMFEETQRENEINIQKPPCLLIIVMFQRLQPAPLIIKIHDSINRICLSKLNMLN